MWRAVNFVGRGVRNVRPSQCCPQDCSEEGPSKYHNHYKKVSKAQAATLKHYSADSCWNPLRIKSKGDSLGGSTCCSTQAVYPYLPSLSKVSKGIHTSSLDNGSQVTEKRDSSSCHPRCPPWHWQILEDSQKLEKCCAEEEEKEEKQNTEDWEKTCHSQEWKEVLQSSPTLHALGWCSAAALTWSLYHDWSEHPLCPYRKKNEQQPTPHSVNNKHNLISKDVRNQYQRSEETLKYHKLFKDFAFESNDQKVSSQPPDTEDCCKHYSRETYKIPNLLCNLKTTKIGKPNLVKLCECQSQEIIIPEYSIYQGFHDLTRHFFSTEESNYVIENHKLEEICQDKDEHDVNESLEDEWCNVLHKTDSGCISDLNQNPQSQSCNTKLEISQNQYKQKEESHIIKTVSDTNPERTITDVFRSEETPQEEVVSQHQATEQNEPENNSEDIELKMLCDKLLEIVKTHHEEKLSDALKKDGKTLLHTKPEEMAVYFQAGVLVGDPISAFNLAVCYHMGHGVTQDLEKARKLYEVASAAGHGWATYNLGVMLNQGLGGPHLPKKAHSMLLQAAKMGVQEAKDALLVLEEEQQQQQQTIPQKDEPQLRQCYSEPCLFSDLDKEWPSSYSTGDLHSLLYEDDSTLGDFITVETVSEKISSFRFED